MLKFAKDALCVEAGGGESPRLAQDAEQMEDNPQGEE